MKLPRHLGIAQSSAWRLGHRIREAVSGDDPVFSGPSGAGETHTGRKEGNRRESKRLKAGRGTAGKTAAAGVKGR